MWCDRLGVKCNYAQARPFSEDNMRDTWRAIYRLLHPYATQFRGIEIYRIGTWFYATRSLVNTASHYHSDPKLVTTLDEMIIHITSEMYPVQPQGWVSLLFIPLLWESEVHCSKIENMGAMRKKHSPLNVLLVFGLQNELDISLKPVFFFAHINCQVAMPGQRLIKYEKYLISMDIGPAY